MPPRGKRDPEIECVPASWGPDAALSRPDGVRSMDRIAYDAFDEQRIEPLGVSARGQGRRWSANTPGREEPGAASRWRCVWAGLDATTTEGVTRLEVFSDEAEALEAAGLSE